MTDTDALCSQDGGQGDNHDGGRCVCSRPANHPLRDIPVKGAANPSSHRCDCGDVWVDGTDFLYASTGDPTP